MITFVEMRDAPWSAQTLVSAFLQDKFVTDKKTEGEVKMKKIGIAAVLLAVGIGSQVVRAEEQAKRPVRQAQDRPNVIFIITDDQHRDSFGFLEGKALTPNIDKIAKEGAYFDRSYVISSVCTPSRFTCLSGQIGNRSPVPEFKHATTEEGVTRVLWNLMTELFCAG